NRDIPGGGDVGRLGALFGSTFAGSILGQHVPGFVPVGEITGHVFNDTDGNGVQNGSEAGLAGRTVFLDQNNNGMLDAGEASVQTDANGLYTFNGLIPGTYTVTEVLPTGWLRTAPAAGFYTVFTSGQTVTGKDFGNAEHVNTVVTLSTSQTPSVFG